MRIRCRWRLAAALAVTLTAAGCGSRIDHALLLAEARGGGPGPGQPVTSEIGAPDAGGVAPTEVPAAALASTPPDPANSAAPSPAQASAAMAAPTPRARSAAPVSEATPAPAGPARVPGEPAPSPTAQTQPTGKAISPPAGTAPAATAPACTGKEPPLILGSVSLLSGPIGAIVKPMVKGAQTWVAATNAKGGLRCQKINYLVADDGGDPSRHQTLVRQQVEQHKVQAFLQLSAILTGNSSVEYIRSKRIPVVGSDTVFDHVYTEPMYFPQQVSGRPMLQAGLYGAGELAKLTGKSKLGVLYCVEAAICTTLAHEAEALAPKAGMELVYSAQVSVAQPSYLAECQAASDAGVEILFLANDPPGMSRTARSCASVNYRPQYIAFAIDANTQLADDPNLDGLAVVTGSVPWFVNSTPATVEFQQAMKTFAPGQATDPGTMIGWVSGKLLEKAVAQSPAATLDSAGILAGLWTIKNDDLGGLTSPRTFAQDQPAQPNRCWWLVQANEGTWTSPNDARRGCV
jgi:branched-chain amino acid transport system substrate-binding protein